VGIARKPAIVARTLSTLEAAGIEPRLVTTTAGRVCVHVSSALVDQSVRLLHDALIARSSNPAVSTPSASADAA
jgi:aspartokinase